MLQSPLLRCHVKGFLELGHGAMYHCHDCFERDKAWGGGKCLKCGGVISIGAFVSRSVMEDETTVCMMRALCSSEVLGGNEGL